MPSQCSNSSNPTLVPGSVQQVLACSYSWGDHTQNNYGCSGGLLNNSFAYAASNPLESATAFPYVGGSNTKLICPSTFSNQFLQATSTAYNAINLGSNSASAMVSALAYGPIATTVDAT